MYDNMRDLKLDETLDKEEERVVVNDDGVYFDGLCVKKYSRNPIIKKLNELICGHSSSNVPIIKEKLSPCCKEEIDDESSYKAKISIYSARQDCSLPL